MGKRHGQRVLVVKPRKREESKMYYGFYSHPGWFSPWGPYAWLAYSMFGGWPPPYPPYGWMGQMPYPPGAGDTPFGSPMTPGQEAPYGWMGQMPYPPGAGIAPFGPPMTPEQEVEFLRNQAQMLKDQLDQIDNRISELADR